MNNVTYETFSIKRAFKDSLLLNTYRKQRYLRVFQIFILTFTACLIHISPGLSTVLRKNKGFPCVKVGEKGQHKRLPRSAFTFIQDRVVFPGCTHSEMDITTVFGTVVPGSNPGGCITEISRLCKAERDDASRGRWIF